ncbi:hypothetical protein ABTX60_07565 [Streptomyces sp. NPDC126510]|uniref:hypothetical protein n=1 Tax=Streptomyces sp. NPDC126510 TaxID=3155317 RepID=UPI00332591A2
MRTEGGLRAGGRLRPERDLVQRLGAGRVSVNHPIAIAAGQPRRAATAMRRPARTAAKVRLLDCEPEES